MKRLELISLKLKNFKGVKNFELIANGKDINVYGDNEAGKTTLFDAFLWLLFGKDSRNSSNFAIKTLDENNNPIHGLDHEVEGVLSLNGKAIKLKKIFREKWTKKRGSAQRVLEGHTTEHFIDDVPCKMKEYEARVAEILDEEIFKLLTNPAHFNEAFSWKKRRKILLEVCGDVSDDEVIDSNKKLAKLKEFLNDYDIEKFKQMIASQKKKINDELETIPIRIDEINHNLPDVTGIDEKEVHGKIDELKKEIQAKEDEMARIRNGGGVVELQKKLREVESQLIDIRNKHNAANHDKVNAKKQSLYEIKQAISDTEFKIQQQERRIKNNEEDIKVFDTRRDQLRDEFLTIRAEQFEGKIVEHDENCPTCGQSLPQEQIDEAHRKAQEKYERELAEFNRKKAEKLERINEQGLSLKAQSEERQKDIEVAKAEIEKLNELLQSQKLQLDVVQKEIEELENNVISIEENAEYVAKMNEAKQIEQEISEVQANFQSAINQVQTEINELRNEISELEADLSKVKAHKQSEKRIAELEEQERKLAEEYEKLEEHLFLAEEFTRTKVEMLEEKINRKFRYARFQLFEKQLNGGFNDVCETLYKGVPYSKGLNNAARINVGLDIINTLSEHYGFSAPIFVDNAEAVTELIDVNAQVIKLIVSKGDKKLRIEHPGKMKVEAV